MAKKSDCVAKVFASFKEQGIDQKTAKEAVESVRRMLKKAGQNVDPSSTEFRQRVIDRVNLIREATIEAKRQQISALRAAKRLDSIAKERGAKGILEAIEGGNRNDMGGFSIQNIRGAVRDITLQPMAELKARNLFDYAQAKESQHAITKELWALRGDNPDSPGLTGDKNALEVAKIYRKAFNNLHSAYDRYAGVKMGYVEGYVGRQTHSPDKMRAAGFEAWAKSVAENFDLERSLEITDPAAQLEVLQAMYNDLSGGKHVLALGADDVNDIATKYKFTSNKERQLLKNRTLIAKDADSYSAYRDQFGSGSLFDDYLRASNHAAKNIPLVHVFGPNPEKMKIDVLKALSESGAKPSDQRKILNAFKVAAGSPDAPELGFFSRALRYARNWMTLSLNNRAVLASMTDMANTMAVSKGMFDAAYLNSFNELFSDYIRLARSDRAGQEALSDFGMALEHFYAYTADAASGDWLGEKIGKALQVQQKITLMNAHIRGARGASALMVGKRLGDYADSAFDGLPEYFKDTLSRYEISPKEWDAVRQSISDYNGKTIITPESLDEVPVEVWKSLAGPGLSPEQARGQVELKLRSIFTDVADRATSTPGIKENRQLFWGTEANDPVGAMARMVLQFKSVALKNWDTIRFASNRRGVTQSHLLGSHLAMGVGIAYFSHYLNEALNGKTPSSPSNPETVMTVLTRTGFLTIYGDLIVGSARSQNSTLLDSLAGPALGKLSQNIEIAKDAAAGQRVGGRVANQVIQSIPFQNIWWGKYAMDYLLFNSVREIAQPGYNARLEGYTRKNPGLLGPRQEYFLPGPTERLRPLK